MEKEPSLNVRIYFFLVQPLASTDRSMHLDGLMDDRLVGYRDCHSYSSNEFENVLFYSSGSSMQPVYLAVKIENHGVVLWGEKIDNSWIFNGYRKLSARGHFSLFIF